MVIPNGCIIIYNHCDILELSVICGDSPQPVIGYSVTIWYPTKGKYAGAKQPNYALYMANVLW